MAKKKKQTKTNSEKVNKDDKVLFDFSESNSSEPGKTDAEQKFEPIAPDDMAAIVQEANRIYFHPLGLEIVQDNECFWIEKPPEQPCLRYGDNVIDEIKNVERVQKMRTINSSKRLKTFGYRVQPVMVSARVKV